MSKYLPDFAGIFCLAIFLITISTISEGLFSDGDPFWHIKAGSVMLEQGHLIDSDFFHIRPQVRHGQHMSGSLK